MAQRRSGSDVAPGPARGSRLAGNLRCALRLTHFCVLVFTVAPCAFAMGLASGRALRLDPEVRAPVTKALLRWRVRFLSWVCRWATLVCGIQVDVRGVPASFRQGLILANHVSYLDVVAIGAIFPCGFVAKREIASWPLIGSIARGLGCVFLDRDDLSSRVRTLHDLRKLLGACDMCVFPEGTTTAGRSPSAEKWRTGQTWAALGPASGPILGVLAVALSYSDHERALWTDDAAFLPHLIGLLKRGPIAVRLAVTPLHLPCAPYELTHPRAISRAARAAVSELCSEPQPV